MQRRNDPQGLPCFGLFEFLWLIREPQLHRTVFKAIADLRSRSPPERWTRRQPRHACHLSLHSTQSIVIVDENNLGREVRPPLPE